ncbi:MAG TPA: 30S ribosome-binding factor RbfA [Gemmatimonadota bacterium]|nr:30S ribosome-binding factor RbfA [Gemmatimonadota bacterium]
MPHRFRRVDRVDELLKQEIARIVRLEVKDPRVGFATIMDVASTPDFRHARVYVSIMGTEEEKQASLDALRGASGFIRSRVGQGVTLKRLPELHFELDRTLERAARIDALLDELAPPEGADD